MQAQKTIFITGADGGMGSLLVPALLDAGWKVYAGVRSEMTTLPAHKNLQVVRCDVTDDASVASAARAIARWESAGLKAVVNLAGVPVQGPVEVVPEAALRQAFEVNFFGPFRVMQHFLPLLRAGKGRIVNVSGVLAEVAVPFTGPIAASKGALTLLSDAARMELSKWHIPVVVVEPSGMRTPAIQQSQKSLETCLDDATPTHKQYYTEMVQKAASASFASDDPQVAVGMIIAALESSKPKAYYFPGHGARMIKFLSHFPVRLRDRMIMRSMKLTD